jgi:phytoene dehydrogenase-like protein
MMSSSVGKRAVVVGAGMGGLTVAAAVAGHFEHVLVLERDTLPPGAGDRAGIPPPTRMCTR